MLAVGEIRTALLQNSAAVPAAVASQVLALLPGERVRSWQRPIGHAVSPDRLTGLDCRLASSTGARTRAIGTAVTRAAITGGRVLQASSQTVLVSTDVDRRLPWSHYLARPGVLELVRRAGRSDRVSWAALADGFLESPGQPGTLDLSALDERILNDVVMRPELDRRPPFRVQRTVLRWAAEATADDAPAAAHFSLVTGTLRTARLALPAALLPAVLGFCEDLALHDWLLTTVIGMIERSRPDATREAGVQRIRPAVDHLLHLWMPAARVDTRLLPLWESLERRPGFTRQWDVSVNRIRDQIAATTVGLLSKVAEGVGRA
jgi:hypothetical protein